MKYAVTPALKLTATINPDFGQVEADPAVVNLSAFETFFSEKRPFFIEGSGTYQFECRDCSLFYSRRIGRAPRGAPTIGSDEFMVNPVQTTILGASKLTGRVGAFSVGALAAATQEEHADIAFGSLRRSEVTEPAAFYSVSRARREFSDQSSLGFIFTTTHRDLKESVAFLPESAVTGGIDYDWRIGKRWGLNGYWAGSSVNGSPLAIDVTAAQQRPQLPAARRRPRRSRSARGVAARSLRDGVVRQDRWRPHADERQRRVQVARLRRERCWVPAARRHHHAERLVPVPADDARQVHERTVSQLQPVVGVQLCRRPAGDGRQRQRELAVPESVASRGRNQRQRADVRRSADARRSRRLHRTQHQQLAVVQHERPTRREPAVEFGFREQRARAFLRVRAAAS